VLSTNYSRLNEAELIVNDDSSTLRANQYYLLGSRLGAGAKDIKQQSAAKPAHPTRLSSSIV